MIVIDGSEQELGLVFGESGALSWKPLAVYARRVALQDGTVNPATVLELPDGGVHVAEGEPLPDGEDDWSKAMQADESLSTLEGDQ